MDCNRISETKKLFLDIPGSEFLDSRSLTTSLALTALLAEAWCRGVFPSSSIAFGSLCYKNRFC